MKLTPLHEKKTLRKLIVVRVMISDKKDRYIGNR